MAAPNRGLVDLSGQDRLELEAWLVEFDQRWDPGLLPEKVRRIPSASSWRLPALCEMVKIDLERQWKRGNHLSLESYLKEYPELGNPADVSADLIQAEYEVRKQFDATVDLDEYARRFPAQVEELRRLVASGRPSLSLRPKSRPRIQTAGERKRGHAHTAQKLPKEFGRYRIIRRLGAGGMGSVYLAEDTRLKRKVALKVAHIVGSESREVLERFYHEAEAAAGLDHPYLCKVYDVDEIENVHYLTMEYIEGTTLASFVTDRRDRPQRQMAAIVGKLALALQEAHAKGVVHRDLKPANVMIRKTGQKAPVIVDFGLAHQINTGGMRLTQTGQAMGTPHYMAIEQVRGDLDAVGPASDIYALGVMLYELLTGKVPFDGPNPTAVIAQILTTQAAPPSSLRPDLDPRLEAICLKAMAREIRDRYASMAEFAAALTEYLQAPATAVSDADPVVISEGTGERASRTQGSDTLMGQFLEKPTVKNTQNPNILILSNVSPVVIPGPAPEGEAEGPRPRRPMTAWIAAASVVLLLGVIVVYVVTDQGRIKITVYDPGAVVKVKVDGAEVRLEALDEPIILRAGEHNMTVSWRNAETVTRKFSVGRGVNKDVVLEYEPMALKQSTASREAEKGSGAVQNARSGSDKVTSSAASSTPAPARSLVSSDQGSRAGKARDDNGLKLKLRWCPPGAFRMGSPTNEPGRGDDEGPVNVTLSRGFWMGQFEVTQSQWQSIMGSTIDAERAKAGGEKLFGAGADYPMYYLSHTQAEEFCHKLTESERGAHRLPPGWEYRLPTEAQWEYACRAGTTTATAFGDRLSSRDANFLGDAPFNGADLGPYLDKTAPVGRYRPNDWGIYDMHGNVWEWCCDGTAGLSFFDHVEPLKGGVDPVGPGSAPGRVMRGGSWRIPGRDLRSAFRLPRARDFRYSDLGFRVALVPSEQSRVQINPGGSASKPRNKKPMQNPTGGPGPAPASPSGASLSRVRQQTSHQLAHAVGRTLVTLPGMRVGRLS